MGPERDATALIIGGGIAGLTAAIALRERGIDSLVFEQSDEVRKAQLGSGLSLGWNVTRAARQIGLLDELKELSTRLTGLKFTTHKGRHIARAPLVEEELALGILRPALHGLLARTWGEDRLRLGHKFVRFEQDGDVTAHFADGRAVRGEVLIGADGLQSAVRAQLHGESEPRYRGYSTRRGILQRTDVAPAPQSFVLGWGKRVIHYPVGQGWVYWTAAKNEEAVGKEEPAEIKRKVLEDFKGWPEPIESLVRETDDSHLFAAPTYDRDPLDRWGEGRVTLIGDAAHPMTWDRGQGAGQGIEGAVLLARELAEGDDPDAALRAWEAQRIPRTAQMVKRSRAVGFMEQSKIPLVRFFHHRVIKLTSSSPARWKKTNKDLLVEYGRPGMRKASRR